MNRILFVCAMMMDVTFTLDSTFPIDINSVNSITSEDCSPGGNGITMVCAARMGNAVIPCGAVGNDIIGDMYIKALRDENIPTETVKIDDGYVTSKSIVLVDDNRVHTYLYNPIKHMDEETDPMILVENCDMVYLSGFTMMTEKGNEKNQDTTLSFLRAAKKMGKTVFFDPGPLMKMMTEEKLEEILEGSDYILLNLSEAREITGELEPDDCAVDMERRYRGMSVVKTGENGCVIAFGNKVNHYPAFTVPVVNTNGAGDTFAAAFMSGIGANLPLDDTIVLSSAAAAIKVSRGGAADCTPTLSQIRLFLSERGLPILL